MSPRHLSPRHRTPNHPSAPVSGRTAGRAPVWLILLLLSITLGGCATQSQRMRDLLNEGAIDETIREGEDWLQDKSNDDLAERDRVEGVLATARMRQLGDRAPLTDYQAFRDRFFAALTPRQRRALMQRTAAASWREEAQPAGTADAIRTFRRQYPKSTLIGEAREAEVALAFAEQDGLDSIDEQRAFREAYAGWPEAPPWMTKSRGREARLAFDLAERGAKVEVWQAWQARYAPWEEAAPLIKDARNHEALIALGEADGDLDALEAFGQAYPFGPWPRRAQKAIARLVLKGAVDPIIAGGVPTGAALDRLEPHLWRPAMPEEAGRHRDAILASARAATRSEPLRLARMLFADFDPGLRETELAWAEAAQIDTAIGWADFARRYPQDDRAPEAERASWLQHRLDQAQRGWPRAEIAYRRALPNGELELTVDVKDCDGRRISGLTAEAFEVIDQRQSHRPDAFQGLEEDRPLDLSFVIDLSGSMSDEREAVRRAVTQFAETFRYRGRDARLGLVSFSDTVVQKKRPARGTKSLLKWLNSLPANQGGAGEDSADSLLTASALMSGRGRERVAVLFTDEDLQMNQAGMRKLGQSSARICGRLLKAVQCMQKCRTARCRLNCYARINRDTRRTVNRCRKRHKPYLCERLINGNNVVQALSSCSQPIANGSDVAVDLGERLRKARVRPYFVVPHHDTVKGRRIQGFDTVAQSAGGQVRSVTHHRARPAAYTHALLDIADQLSKQYVLRYKPTPGTPAPAVVVGYDHRWRHHRPPPPSGVHAVLAAGETQPGCPTFVAVSAQTIQISACGPWKTFANPADEPIRDAAAHGDRVALMTDTALYALDAASGGVTRREPLLARHEQMHFDTAGRLWVLGRDAAGRVRLQRDDALFADAAQMDGPATLLPPTDPEVPCLLATGARWCWRDRWVKAEANAPIPATPRRVVRVDGLVSAILMLSADGVVHRSVDNGLRWRPALADAKAHTLVVQADGAACAAGTGIIRCSRDAGLTWASVGQYTASGTTGLTTLGADVYLSDATGLSRLERVVGRDIPASALYFPTDVDQFSPRLRPFLLDIAQTMRDQPTLGLVVEGHADHRGSDEHNDALALRRAQSVAQTIIATGVAPKRLQVVGHGSHRPLRQGNSKAALQQNRRVELIMLRPPRRGPRFDDCGRPIAQR